ncbi:DUF3365 domain-containing protein [Desulfurispirillum indicum]|uniref:c-type heme family protein n=1 Tax=Desulfurispirillum indicum TaxID=936456 RepID=UPI001CFAB154|nr:DUF3365 domain-containing protein [Desulfurispirillum indicum]UCZ57591.1 DUF3365 domain-containing protein [Desulfurispirillum indicum]
MLDLIRKYVIFIYVFMTLILFAVFFAFGMHLSSSSHEQLLDRGRTFLQEIVYVRRWVSLHGGIYVKRQEGMIPSPHLEKIFGNGSSIRDEFGNEYLLRTPAMVTHEVSDLANIHGAFAFRMAGLLPINPKNQADDFETASIERFRAGEMETFLYEKRDGKPFFRYMAPLPIEPTCVRCHTNYVPGEIHGGISIWVPADAILNDLRSNRQFLTAASAITVVLALMGVYFLTLPFSSRVQSRMKTVQDRWQEAEKKYQHLFHRIHDGIMVLSSDTEGRLAIADVNDTFCRQMGYPREVLLQLRLTNLVAAPHGVALKQSIREFFDQRSPSATFLESHLSSSSGELIAVEISLSFLELEHMEVVVAIVRDIRERKRLEEQRQILVQQSKMATMGQMLSNITHQWGQPLTGLSLILQDIKKRYAQEVAEPEHFLGQVEKGQENIRFLTQTVRVFRDFLRPSRQKTSFDIARATEEVLQILSPLLQHHQIPVVLYRCHGESTLARPMMICGYANEFKQVVLNIVGNAKDAIVMFRNQGDLARGEGRVELRLYEESGKYIVEVFNTGTRIPEGMEEEIFREHVSTRPSGMGTGLYMARSIIDGHMGGRIYAANTDGGVVFTLQLPPHDGTTDCGPCGDIRA